MQWFIFILILPHLKPPSLEYMWPVLDTAFDAARVASAMLILLLYLLRRKVPSAPVWILAALQGWLFLATYLNGRELWGIVINTVSILTVACAIDLFSTKAAFLIRGIMGNMEWLIYGNLLSVLLTYPQGLYISDYYQQHCYYLGYHNGFFQYVLPAVLTAALYSHIEKKKARSICLAAAGYLCVLITWSATSVAALMLVTVLMLLPSRKLRRWITFTSIFGTTMAFNLAISVFRIIDRVPFIPWFIERVLHKSTTLTGRTYMWDQFIQKFCARPFLGYGVGEHVLLPFSRLTAGAHNQYFEYLLEGGIVALALFLLFNIQIGKELNRCGDEAVRTICLSVLAGLYIIFIAESYMNFFVYMLMMLVYHAEEFASVTAPTTRRLRIVWRRA